jgi:hypothetical protein
LNRVAGGTITPEEGAARLAALEATVAAPPQPAPATQAAIPLREVQVISRFGNTEVIGDPSVAYAVADGPHQARQEGETMVIEQSPLTDGTSFEFNRPYARVSIPGFDFHRKLVVRMNPALALRSKVQAGNLRIEGVRGPVTTDVQAGNCVVSGFAGPINLSVAAGNIDATGRLDGGESAIRCSMGEVKVRLDRTSSVRVNAHIRMGEVDTDGIKSNTIGSGAGVLDVDCMMGNVRLELA